MKRTIIILLIAASVGVTVFLNLVTEPVDPSVKSRIEAEVLAQPEFPARPVWWDDDTVLAVGVTKTRSQHIAEAEKVCRIVKQNGLEKLRVEVYDLTVLQQTKEWELIGSADCGLQR